MKNFKAVIMTALATALSSNVSPEAVAWADSHLPNSDELGNKQSSSRESMEELWSGFKFTKSELVERHGQTALSTNTKDLIDMSTILRLEAKRIGVKSLNDPMQMINLTKALNKEQFAIIVLQGLTAFGEKMTQLEKDILFEMLRNDDPNQDDENIS